MSEWIEAAQLTELSRRKRKLVTVNGHEVALFLVNGHVYALRDVCIHKQRSLSRGTILHGRVVCPGHQWSFDPATGYVEEQDMYQPTFDVRVDGDGTVYVSSQPRVRSASIA